jgi:hypothetical protein
MENHFFSDPVPIATSEDYNKIGNDNSIRTWKVVVYRRQGCNADEEDNDSTFVSSADTSTNNINGAIEVDVLYINENSFPPRKAAPTRQNNNKKGSSNSAGSGGKILWKLPDNYDTIPKFGHIEQNRLWELYKQQKKERRKKLSNIKKVDIDTNELLVLEETPIHTKPTVGLPNSPPPGFSALPGIVQTSRPPPGFQLSQRSKSPLIQHEHPDINNGEKVDKLVQKHFVVEIPQQGDQSSSMHPQLCDLLGNIVTHTFAESLSSNCVEDGWLPYYLNGFVDETNIREPSKRSALSTLLIGTGKVNCTNYEERYQQWKSLSQIGSIWEIHGFTAQSRIVSHTIRQNGNVDRLNGNANISPNISKGNGNNSSKKKKKGSNQLDSNNGKTVHPVDIKSDREVHNVNGEDDVLLVMTGKVFQPQTGWFGYSLSLYLSTTFPITDMPIDTKEPKKIIHNFVIVNEVLTLFAMS